METNHQATDDAGMCDHTKVPIETTPRHEVPATSNSWFQQQVISAQPGAQQASPPPSEYSRTWLISQQAAAQREEMIKSTERAVCLSLVYCLFVNVLFGIVAMVLAWNAQNDAHDGNLDEARRWIQRSRVAMVIGVVVSCVAVAVIIYIYVALPNWVFKH